MIKVNLLRDHTVKAKKITAKPSTSHFGLLMLVMLLVVSLGLGGAWYKLHAQMVTLTSSRDLLRLESARLQQLRKQIEQFEKMKTERQSRISVIEQLKANQAGPVLLLNHVIRSIPTSAALWLTGIEQKGDQIRITGFTVRGETIPDFMSNLSATGYFKSVDLELYEDQHTDSARFALVCIAAPKTGTE
jgi:type IV pilus assembly protein PilN